ncbi:MAG: class I SAM-dependent methyltransferase [Candidatus Omnitrophota bacterium]
MQKEIYRLNYQLEETHWWFLGRRDIFFSSIRRLIHQEKLSPPLHILDYGCGTGGITLALSAFGMVLGADESDDAIAFCRSRGLDNIQKVTSPRELPEAAFDLVCCLDALEHVEDDVLLLGELRRALRPRGILLITVPALPMLWGGEDVVSHHVRRYRRRELADKLTQAGFSTVRASYFNTLLLPAIFGKRLFNRFFRPSTLNRSDLYPVWPPLNAILYRIFSAERILMPYISYPLGASLLFIAQKEEKI